MADDDALVSLLEHYADDADKAAAMAFDQCICPGFDIKSNVRFESAEGFVRLLRLVPRLPSAVAVSILRGLDDVLSVSLRNATCVSQAGGAQHVVELLARESAAAEATSVRAQGSQPSPARDTAEVAGAGDGLSAVFRAAAGVLERLGSVSLPPATLKAILRLLQSDDENFRPRCGHAFVSALQRMADAQNSQPSTFFDFDGDSPGIALRSGSRFSPKNGYGVAMWLRLERNPSYSPLITIDQPGTGAAVRVALNPNQLVMRIMEKDGAVENVLTMHFPIQPKKWYFVVLVHNHKVLWRSAVSAFIDGNEIQTSKAKYPSFSRDHPIEIAFGSNETAHFNGQIGRIAVLESALSQDEVAALYALGPNFNWTFDPSDAAAIEGVLTVDGVFTKTMANKVYVSYTPLCTDGMWCLNGVAPPEHERELRAARTSAVKLVHTNSVRDSLFPVGGMNALLPLFAQLDQPVRPCGASASEIDTGHLAHLLYLLRSFLDNHYGNQSDMLRCSGFHVIADLLRAQSPQHRNMAALEALQAIVRTIQESEELYRALYGAIYLDWGLWVHAPVDVHREVLRLVSWEAEVNPHIFQAILPLQKIVDDLRVRSKEVTFSFL